MVLRICGTPSLLASSVLKLTARKGLTLISLSALGFIKWWNSLGTKYIYSISYCRLINRLTDTYHKIVLLIRLLTGVIVCLLSLIDIGQSKKVFHLPDSEKIDWSSKFSGAAIWNKLREEIANSFGEEIFFRALARLQKCRKTALQVF